MPEVIILDRSEDGIAIAYYAGQPWRRMPDEEPDSPGRWSEKSNEEEPADDKTQQILEDAYRSPDTPIVNRWPQVESGWNQGDPVFDEALGFGKIIVIHDGKFVVKFGKDERVLRAEQFKTRVQAELDWHFYWRTGKRRRREEGRRLSIVKQLCRHGEWQAFLTKYNYPRSTADDLIELYEAGLRTEGQSDLPGNRSNELGDLQDKARARDRDEVARKDLVNRELEKRRGKQPTHRKTWWAVRIELPPDIVSLCRRKYKGMGKKAKRFWRRAAYKFAGVKPSAKKDHS